jgi:hypothetical protein
MNRPSADRDFNRWSRRGGESDFADRAPDDDAHESAHYPAQATTSHNLQWAVKHEVSPETEELVA